MTTTMPSAHRLLRLKLAETNVPAPDSLLAELYLGDERLLRWTGPLPGADTRPALKDGPQWPPDPARIPAPPPEFDACLQSVASTIPPGGCLWIELARPKGCLTTKPWERWLSPIVRRPLLRLPHFPFKPIRPRGGLHVAYCASAPAAKAPFDAVGLLVENCRSLIHAGIDVTFHVFLDVQDRSRLQGRERDGDIAPHLRVHVPPASLSESNRDPATAGDPLASPWLRWIASALPARGVDLVHFVNHGYLSRGRGAMALARHPVAEDDPTTARFVYADELVHLLDVAGASGVVLTSPPENYSVGGLLALADELIGCRPGPVVFHDVERDATFQALAGALAFLYGEGAAPISDALALCAHPDRLHGLVAGAGADVAHRTEEGQASPAWKQLYRPAIADPRQVTSSSAYQQVLEKYTLAHRVKAIDVPGATAAASEASGQPRPPAPPDDTNWMVSCQRVLERHTARLASAPLESSGSGQAQQKGVEEALLYVKGVLDSEPGKEGA